MHTKTNFYSQDSEIGERLMRVQQLPGPLVFEHSTLKKLGVARDEAIWNTHKYISGHRLGNHIKMVFKITIYIPATSEVPPLEGTIYM